MQHSAETFALTLVMCDDVPGAMNIVDDMTVREKTEFMGQLDTLRGLLTDQFGNVLDTRRKDTNSGRSAETPV